MVTESSVAMMSEMRMIGAGGGDGLEMLLRDQHWQDTGDRERELNLYRSGSAPPTVDGSLAAIGGLFGREAIGGVTEEELRSDPAYHSYYYSHVNLNPRLPPPVLSKEDWRFSQRLQGGLGGIGDKRRNNRIDEQQQRSNSLFSLQPGFQQHMETEVQEWGGGGLIGMPELELGLGRQNSIADIFQDDLDRATPVSGHPSRPASRNAFGSGIENLNSDEPKFALHHDSGYLDGMQHSGKVQSVAGFHNNGGSAPQTFASVVGKSLSRSNTPDPQRLSRAPSPCHLPVGVRLGNHDKKNNGSCSVNGVSPGIAESSDLVTTLSGMSLAATGGIDRDIVAQSKLQQEIDSHQKFLFGSQGAQDYINQRPSLISNPEHLNISSAPHLVKPSYPDSARKTGSFLNSSNTSVRPNGHVEQQKPTLSSPNQHLRSPSSFSVTSPTGSPSHNTDTDGATAAFASYGLNGYSINPALSSMMSVQLGTNNLPPLFENNAAAAAVAATAMGSPGINSRAMGGFPAGSNLSGIADLHHLNRIGNNAAAAALQYPLVDPLYIQYLRAAEYAAQIAANFGDPSLERTYLGNSYADLLGMQNANLGALLQPQKPYGMPFVGKLGGLNNGYYGNPAFGFGMPYPGSSLASPVLPGSPVGPDSPLRHGERSMHIPSGLRNIPGSVMGSWHSDTGGNLDGSFPSSLLEEFKSNKTKCYELSDIVGHVVEFSADQYGSRFIQQKLESATVEEKNMVFEEIMPQAFSLITDVFGNYVIQKFFEHGSADQRRELAEQLTGHVLTLSLQMYGCRVIQKAIEVVDLDQQTKMVAELDGHVMRCVRDQNGNHVIQKCIECVPQEEIQFIISSFYDQVVTLSTHPYGCRVIQRVLEHCDDPKTQQIMMDEIMKSVCMLAQDQYGNYVIQHVLEHGKPHERSEIIKKLAGLIVQMSQQKFASNVVEKCLTFGGPEERRFLVNEMLGSTEENEPLQAMMKDQFANYVVQKVLETCDEMQREHILARIKVHLNALKKYTYGKHIVARVEKLVAAGERRIGVQSSCVV